MGILRVLTLIGCLIASTQILAQDCFEIDSSSEAKECMSEKLDLADRKLLLTYQANLKSLDNKGKKRLIKAQRLWIQFKEEDCAQIISQIDDRTHGSLLVFQCLIDKSIQREKELHSRLVQ